MRLRGGRSAVSRSKQQTLILGTATWILFQEQWAGEFSFLKEHHKMKKMDQRYQWKLSVMLRNCPGKRWCLGPRCRQEMWEHCREGCVLTVLPRRQDQGLCSGGNRKREPWVASAFSIGHLIPCRNAQSSHTGSLNYTRSGPPPCSVASTQDVTPVISFISCLISSHHFPQSHFQRLQSYSCLSFSLINCAFSWDHRKDFQKAASAGGSISYIFHISLPLLSPPSIPTRCSP